MTRILALGDSHLDRLGPRRSRLVCPAHGGGDVLNLAVGGSRTSELAGQVAEAAPEAGDLAVVSIGTNDAASWYPLPLAESLDLLATALRDLRDRGLHRVVLVTTPGVDLHRLPMSDPSTEPDLAAHASAYSRLAAETVVGVGPVVVVDAAAVLAGLGREAFVDDGLHLSDAAYDVLLPVVAAALCGHAPPAG